MRKKPEIQPITRAGQYTRQSAGYKAFVPAPFPPEDIEFDRGLLLQNSKADVALGKLVGAASILPDPDLFVFMYVRREAVLSSQIEGTQASLMDILEYEASLRDSANRVDVAEVSNYIAAMNYGLSRITTLPLSLRLIREIHERLMKDVRGGESAKTPGEFRRSQNWVGGPTPELARYVPPPVSELDAALDQFETSLHAEFRYPLLVEIGIRHAQFETIHPFLDGNGRMGRLLITLLLCHHGILRDPLLYLSIYFKKHRQEYYDRLQAIRDKGDWEGWLAFFLEGVAQVAIEATSTARQIVELREQVRTEIATKLRRRSARAHRLLDHLFRNPVVNVKDVQEVTGLSQPAANALVNSLEEIRVLSEFTGRKRNRMFIFKAYVDLFQEREQRS